jgi:DNA-binding transcriptional ArsR family regulator
MLDDLGELAWRCTDATPVLRVLDQLVQYGLVEVCPAGEEHYEDLIDFAGVDSLEDIPEDERQVVRILPLGARAMYDARLHAGVPTLTLDDLATETAEVFFARVGPLSEEAFDEGAQLWLEARAPERAIGELSEVARRTDDFEHRMLAFQLLAEYGEPGVDAIADLREHSAAGPAALSWLLDAGLIEASEVSGRERTYSMVDVLAAGIRSAGRKQAMEEFAAQPRPAQLLFLADATICGHPRTREVLESMVVAHPDRMVSNAARKALDWLHEPEE